MIIFDIGTNLGIYTDALLQKYPEAQFVCVEANPELVVFLLDKFKNFSNVKILHYAVSDEPNKFVDFHISNQAHTVSTVSENWIKNSRFAGMVWDKTIQIDTVTIEELVDHFGSPDIIKIDVEGYELAVINGMKKSYGTLSFEWAEEEIDSIYKCCEKLRDLGYTEFSYREADTPFETVPDTFYSFQQFCELFFSQLDSKRKEKWGMVFAKK